MGAAGVMSKEKGPSSRVVHGQKERREPCEVRLRCNFWNVKNESTNHFFFQL